MYKRQMLIQKLVCYLAILAAAVLFIYSLGIMTDLYDSLYSTMMDPQDLTYTTVPGSIVYYNMQGFNSSLVKASIVMILLGLFLFITNTHNRRRYYIANFVSTGLYMVAALAISVWGHIQIGIYRAQWLNVDFAALAKHAKVFKTLYTESTFWFDLHYFVFGLCILAGILLVANLVWKLTLMKGERALLNEGKEA